MGCGPSVGFYVLADEIGEQMNWRRTKDYRIWRIQVIRRDKVCQICKTRKGRQAHHIKNGEHYPEFRFDPDNGICWCGSCHIDGFHSKFMGGTRKKCNEKDMKRFLSLIEIIEGNIKRND